MLTLDEQNNRKFIWQAYNEQDIMAFNEQLLTNGHHTITVSSLPFGRVVLTTLLASLDHYSNVAYLSTAKNSNNLELACRYRNFVDRFVSSGACMSEQAMYDFFIEEPLYDFIWIEESQELVTQPWYPYFLHVVNEMRLAITIPIVTLRTDKS